MVSVREIDAEKSGLKGIECSDEREQRRRLYAMLDKMSYRYWDVERGDAVHVPRPGSMYSSLSSSKEGKEKEAKSRPIRRHTMELQRVVALENDLVAWKETNAKTGGEEMKDALVPKGHCFVASEREDVAHVGVVPIGLIEAKVRCAAFGDDFLKIQRMEKKTWEEMEGGSKLVVRRRSF